MQQFSFKWSYFLFVDGGVIVHNMWLIATSTVISSYVDSELGHLLHCLKFTLNVMLLHATVTLALICIIKFTFMYCLLSKFYKEIIQGIRIVILYNCDVSPGCSCN